MGCVADLAPAGRRYEGQKKQGKEPMKTAEHTRLEEAREGKIDWKKWGPYLSERQWGTVREDYSENGDAWNYFTHDHARSRAYRWGLWIYHNFVENAAAR